ncbi:MAG: hypothetical protein OEY52_02165 [Gammaproteobacteria bacterium]|nr:hypothetical protein [Gammaproteobacteria bacterium]
MNDILEKIFEFITPVQELVWNLFDGVMQQVLIMVGKIGLSKEDFLTGLLLFSAEISFFLLVVILYMRFANARRHRKDVVLAKELKAKIKEYLPGREEKLKAIIGDMVPQDEEWAAKSAMEAAGYEKSLYSRVLKIILRKDMDGAMGIHNDVERLGDGYQRIVTHLGEGMVDGGGASSGGGGGGGSASSVDSAKDDKITELKSIVAKLRKEKQQLQDELEASIKSIDSISKEYSRIYSDAPSKEGTEHIEEELSKLRAKIGVHLDDEDDVPDIDVERSDEIKELREQTGLDSDESDKK